MAHNIIHDFIRRYFTHLDLCFHSGCIFFTETRSFQLQTDKHKLYI